MNTIVKSPNEVAAPNREPSSSARVRMKFGDSSLYLLLTLLVIGAWLFSRLNLFTSGSNTGYWIGVVGGVMMLLLLLYPLRKYTKFMHGVGQLKYWFIVHMVLGVGGPILILVHSTFRIGSLNAAVALICMIVVAISGVVGRFLYVRIHRGLQGEKMSLQELQTSLGFQHDDVKSKLHFAPNVEAALLQFEEQSLVNEPGWKKHFRRLFVLPVQHWRIYFECRKELDVVCARIAKDRRWDQQKLRVRRAKARSRTLIYLSAVVRVAQFSTFVRLFSLWHVLHVPFLYGLLVSAIVHVIAVHAY